MDPITPAASPAAAPAAPPKPVAAPPPVKPAQPAPPPAALKPGVPPAPGVSGDDTSKMVPISALHEEREKRQSLQAELEAMRKVAGPQMLFDINGNPVAQQQHQAAPQVNPVQMELDKLWDSDPRKAVQLEINLAMNWYDQVNSNLDRQEAELASKNPDFNNFRNEVRGYVRSLPPDQRANPGVVELAYYVVRGQKVDSIIERERAEMLRKIQAGESVGSLPPGSAVVPAVPAGQVQLTQDQKQACLALGISEEEYTKWMNK